ncbi:MAG TPA: hypothetical protein VK889_01310 [Solirubrobacterales bacterium]|nr:hypothetical protein [Solirubrobacterales bacterium]
MPPSPTRASLSLIIQAPLNYAIDENDRLIQVDGWFYDFAAANGWDGAEDCLGRVLWDFVAGEDLVKLQRILVRRIRSDVREVELPFRCDGPDVRREMTLRISANESGRLVLFSARMRDELPRPKPQPLLDMEVPRGGKTIEMCGWCDRFFVDDEWVEVEVAAERLSLFAREELPAITHGICPHCSELLLAA